MNRITTFALVAIAILSGAQAVRADGYALVNVKNPTNLTIHYSYQWGDGAWQQTCLYPGQTMLHSWEYAPDSRSSPNFHIRFDPTLRGDRIGPKDYGLERCAHHCKDARFAKQYAFFKSACGCYLDLGK